MVGQFVALRHEVNLQTRASRAQLELNAQALEQLTLALAALERQPTSGQKDPQQVQEEFLRPLLRTLVDLHDSLALARREVQRVQETMSANLEQLLQTPMLPVPVVDKSNPPPVVLTPPWWARLLGMENQVKKQNVAFLTWWQDQQHIATAQQQALAEHLQRHHEQTEALANRVRQAVQSILAGYTMSLQRLERALDQQGLEPVDALGATFDPEFMEVLEAVPDSGQPAGVVLEEVRRGYLWRGRIFRFAQVKVSRS